MTPKVCKVRRKSLVLWADDDWYGMSKKDLSNLMVDGLPDKPCYAIFHFKEENCYEGLPRKVRITIEEIL